jgi:Tfp pilus assembly protein PilN
LSERLSALVGVPVEQARPRELIALGDNIGFSDEELPRLDPYLPAAVGLALGGAGVGTVINLQPRARQSAVTKSRMKIAPGAIAAVVAFAVLLGGLTFMAHGKVSHAKTERTDVQEQASKLRSQLAALAPVLERQNQLNALEGNIKTLLATDVAWQRMVDRITKNLPEGIMFTAFSATSTPPVATPDTTPVTTAPADSSSSSSTETTTPPTTVAPPPPTITGALTFQGIAPDYPTLAKWIDAMGKVPEISDIYVTSAQSTGRGPGGLSTGITFTGTAIPTQKSASDRVGTYVAEAAK